MSFKGVFLKGLILCPILFASSQSLALAGTAENHFPMVQDDNTDFVVKGAITDTDGQPLTGAYALEKGTDNGVITDIDGKFTITLHDKNAVILVSYLGFIDTEVNVNGQSSLIIEMNPDNEQLEGVVVMGYGSQKKKDITGSVSTVQASEIQNIPVTDFGTALAGRTAGVQVLSPSGKPTGGFSIRVRGATSISAGNEPLYVVDGVPTTDTQSVNPDDIASISVLKDASSAAIYGSAGANGVVIITTKSGSSDKSRVEFSGWAGFTSRPKKMDVLNEEEYEQLIAEMGYAPIDKEVYNADIDWQDEMFRTAPVQNYHLSVSGGNDKLKYYVGGGYTDKQGIVAPSSYQRLNFKASFDYQVKKWLKIGTTINYVRGTSKDVKDGTSESVILKAVTTPSVVNRYNELGQFQTIPYLSSLENPLSGVIDRDNITKSNRMIGYFYGELYLPLNFRFKSSIGWEVGSSTTKSFLDPKLSIWGQNQQGTRAVDTNFHSHWINENILSWSNQWKDHSLSALAGFIVSKHSGEGFSTSTKGFENSKLPILGAGTIFNKPTESYWACTNVSALARINYSYANRYMATVNFRADASSKFGPKNRWGFFPSFSFGWRPSAEEFMQNATWIDDLKIRAGWGMVGNDQVGNYSSHSIYGIGANYNVDGVILPGYYQSQLGNDRLRWETTSQTDVGIDWTMFGGRLSLIFDLYYKHTTDLLLNVKLPQSSGFDSGMQNVGAVENKGLELSINSVNIDRAFKWTTGVNFSVNKNKVLDLASSPAIYSGGLDKKIKGNASIVKEGLALGTFWGYQAVGVNPADGEMMYEKANGMVVTGDKLDPDTDRRMIGSAEPKLIYGINNTFSWKGLSLSLLLQGSYGNDVFNASRMFTEGMFDSRNQSVSVLRRWRNPGDITDMPAPKKDNYPLVSSRFIEDGSYLKIRNIKLAYTLPKKVMQKIKSESLTFYVSADNLVTWTNYSGFDPEVNIGGTNATAMGIDQGVVPHPRTYVFGLNFVF